MISKKEVQHIADLSRIGISDEEVKKMSEELSAVLGWIRELNEMETENISPDSHIIELKNVMREDNARNFSNAQEIRKLFPEEKNGYDKVKSVL